MSSLSPERRAAVLARKAYTLAEAGHTDDAVACLDEAIALRPEGAGLCVDKVEVLLKAGRVEQGLAAARAGAARLAGPEGARLLVLEGDALRRLGRSVDACEAYEKARERDPAEAAALARLGNTLAEAGRFKEALAAFDTLLEERPQEADAMLCRGLLLARLGRAAEGLAALDRALDTDPKLLEAYLQRARILRQAGRLDEAWEAAQLAIDKMPRYVEAYTIAAEIALERGDVDAVLTLADSAQALDPTDPDVWRLKGVAHARRGRAAVSTVCRGLSLLFSGQPESALAAMDAALEVDPGLFHAWHQRGVCLEALGRLDDAEQSYRKAIALEDRAAKAHLDLGILLAHRLDRLREGLLSLQRAIAIDSKLWQTLPPDLRKRVNKPAFW